MRNQKEKLNKNFMIQSSNGSYVQLLRSNTSARSETGTPTKHSHIHPEWYTPWNSQIESSKWCWWYVCGVYVQWSVYVWVSVILCVWMDWRESEKARARTRRQFRIHIYTIYVQFTWHNHHPFWMCSPCAWCFVLVLVLVLVLHRLHSCRCCWYHRFESHRAAQDIQIWLSVTTIFKREQIFGRVYRLVENELSIK